MTSSATPLLGRSRLCVIKTMGHTAGLLVIEISSVAVGLHPGFFPQGIEIEERLVLVSSEETGQGSRQKEVFFQSPLASGCSKATCIVSVRQRKPFHLNPGTESGLSLQLDS